MNENIRSLFVSYTRMLKWTCYYVSYKKDKIDIHSFCDANISLWKPIFYVARVKFVLKFIHSLYFTMIPLHPN